MKQCKCGSMAFNLAPEIEQGELCDRHYWQDRTDKAEFTVLKTMLEVFDVMNNPAQFRSALGQAVAKRTQAIDAAIAAHRGQYSELSGQCSELLRNCSELEKSAAIAKDAP